MGWELTDDVDLFAGTTGGFLRSRPVPHTVLLTLVDTLRRRGLHAYGEGDPLFGWWRTPAGDIAGVLVQTPPRPLIVSEMPAEAVAALVAAVGDRPLPGVNLLAGDVAAFTEAWRLHSGGKVRTGRQTRLYRLETLIPPVQPPPGHSRLGETGDRDLLLRWTAEFHEYIGEPLTGAGALVDDRLSSDGVTIWTDDGEPVSMAIRSRPEAGMVRVQMVYTPADLRGHGYAAGATTAVTRDALAAGARDVVLNTDLANPVSNRLYQRLGYRPVEDRTVVELS